MILDTKCSIVYIAGGVAIALSVYFVFALIVLITKNKSNYTTFLQQDTSGIAFPITNKTGYRDPTVGLPIIPTSSSTISNATILAPARAKSIMPEVQETIIFRGPMDQDRNLPKPTFGALARNEMALNPNISGLSN